MTEMRWISNSEAETVRFGEEFGKQYISSGVVVCVHGELGAGKTHFIKGIAGSLGIDERELTSPTFALANEFEMEGQAGNGQAGSTDLRQLYHLDCYRFEKPEELLELGVEDYLYPQHAATIIEWPERIARLIPENAIHVIIDVISETERAIEVRSHRRNTGGKI
jgi:tRNA threonylcarbamoyladenosine biosynthesis protein TsaE